MKIAINSIVFFHKQFIFKLTHLNLINLETQTIHSDIIKLQEGAI